MDNNNLDLRKATFVGIDAHTKEHTAVAINRFEERKGSLSFDNSKSGINQFMQWLKKIDHGKQTVIIGIEGTGNAGSLLPLTLTDQYDKVYEVNPLYTRQRREFGTRADKSDTLDAALIAEVLTRKLDKLSKITKDFTSPSFISLKKLVWLYEDLSSQRAKIKNHLRVLLRDWILSQSESQDETLTFIIGEKKKELKRIHLLENNLKAKITKLLPVSAIRLMTMRGISTVLAARLVAHTKGIERFGNINKFIQYAGIAPVEKSSGTSKSHRINKRGNRLLNSTLYLTAVNQLRWNEKAKEYFEKKVREGKTKKHALRCLMKRVACIVYGMMRNYQRGENN